MTVPLSIVVATCSNRGIGINGRLPWKLRLESYCGVSTGWTDSKIYENAACRRACTLSVQATSGSPPPIEPRYRLNLCTALSTP